MSQVIYSTNVRELEGALMRLQAYSHGCRKISTDLAAEAPGNRSFLEATKTAFDS